MSAPLPGQDQPVPAAALTAAAPGRAARDRELEIPVSIVDEEDERAMETQRLARRAERRTRGKRKRDREVEGQAEEVVSFKLRSRSGVLVFPEATATGMEYAKGVSSDDPDAAPGARVKLQHEHRPLFDLLPDELVLTILTHIPPGDRFACTAVSRRWRRLVWDPALWVLFDFDGCEFVNDVMVGRLTADPRTLSATQSISLRKCHRVSEAALQRIARSSASASLLSLDLSWCSGASDRSVLEFARCGKLRQLVLGHNKLVTRRSIRVLALNCPRLEVLDLRCCGSINDQVISTIALNCSQLRVANFSNGTHITDSAICNFVQKCKLLERLDVSWCTKISNESLFAIAEHLPGLIEIGLAETAITNLGVIHLVRKCSKLQVILIGRCVEISDEPIREIELQLSGTLRQLNVASCRMISTHVIESLMANCLQLRSLDVSMLPCRELTDALERYAIPRGMEVFH